MKTTLRSVLSAVLCYLMLLSVCSAAFPRAMAISGSGTESSPYRITTAEELQYVMTNYGSREGVCLSLQNDIIIPDDYAAPDTFAGVLDGNGHTVTTSVYLIKTNKGTIKNLYRVSSYHTYSSYNESFPLCQYNEGVIRKIVVQGNIVSVSAYKIGGITEENLSSGTIDCCALIGDVRGYDDGCDAGGITAKNSGTICSCYVIGSIYDGVDWYYDSVSYGIAPSYTNCFYYNTREEMRGLETHVMNRLNGSTVSGESWWTKDTENKNDGLPVPASQYSLEATISGPADATLLSSSYSTTVSLSCSDSNAVIRYTTDGSIPTANSPVYSSYGKSFNGTAKITVAAFRSGKSSHPYTFTVKKITGSGTAASPYLIDDEEALRRISKLGTNKYYRQTADITITRPFDTLSEFSGLYDGDGYTISDFYTEGYASFTADNTGEIRNLKIAASTHEPTRVMGLFAETNHGMLSNCSIAGKMENYREYPYCHNICFGAMVDTNYGVMDHCADIEAIYISAIRYFIDLHYRPRKPVDGGFVYKNCGIVRYVKGQVNGAIYRETYYDESNIIQEYCEPLAEGHRHTFVKGTPQVFPCSYYGHCKYVCSGCGETIDQTYYRPYFEDISYEGIVDHTYVEFEGKAATCTEIGWYAYHTCSVCGYTDYQEIPMLPHTPQVVTPGVAATCTTDGLTDYAVCSVCGAVIQQQETIPAPGHQWNAGTVTTPATCRENGVKTFTCTACDETRTEIIPQTTEFSWDGGVATVPADETGIAGYACYNFKDLTGVMLPDSVTSIGAYAFYGCTGLKDVYYAGSEAQRKNITIAGSNSPLTAATWHYNCAVEEGSCGKNATWQLTPYGTLTISGTGAMYNYNDSSSLSPFYHRADVKKVIVENGVTNIGNYAFSGCEELTEVTLPDSVKGIGRFAFYGCTGLTAVALPDGLTGLGIGAFRDCAGLTDVTIPEGIISVAAELFRNCQSLTGIIIPDGVTSVGAYAFANCAGLTELVIPDNVASFGQFAFSGCTGLTAVTLPLSVASVGNNAFNDCDQLAAVRYEGVPADWDAVSIGKNNGPLTAATFEWHCKTDHTPGARQETVLTAAGCETAGEKHVVTACALCGETYVDENMPIAPLGHNYIDHAGQAATCTAAGWEAYRTCSRCEYTTYKAIPKLPHSTVQHEALAPTCTKPGWNAYETCKNCDYSTKTELPALGHDLTSHIAQAATCTAIGWNAYVTCFRCDYSTYKAIPIQPHTVVTDAAVPPTPAAAGLTEGSHCSVCGAVLQAQEPTDIVASGACGTNVTYILDRFGLLTVSGTGPMYNYNDSSSLSPFYHSADVKKVIVKNGVTHIGNHAFAGCTELTDVTIPDSVKGIGRFAFYGCTGLTAVALPDGLTGLGIGAFCDCAGLTDVTIPEGITSVAAELFRNCQSLTGIIIPDGVTSVGAYAFANCAGLTELVIPDNVTSISQFAFSGCTGLTSITVPLSVSSIGNNAFNGCAQLASVRYEGLPADWDAVSIGKNNSSLTAADFEWHCKLPHQYIATADMTPATMTADGSGTLACSLCGATTEATIPHIAAVTLSADTFVYTGAAQRPDVTITDSEGAALTQGEDYTLTLPEDSTAVGTYTLTVSFTGKYASTAAKTYTIAAQALAAANVTRTPIAFYANGKQQQPTVTVVNAAGQTLKVGTDYRVVYPESVEPGSYMVRVDGINNYKGTIRKVYTVKPVEALAAASVTRTPTVFYANGKQQQPKVTVVNAAGQTLKEGTDYRVVYPESVEPGSYMVRVDGINSYKGTIRKAYTVKQARESLDASRITRTPTVFYANGQQQQPTVTVVNAAGQTLKEGMDYRVTYPESVEPGSYMVRVDGINSYKGTIRKVYTVKPVEALAAANVTRTPTVFYANGQQQQPTVTVVNAAGQTLKEGTDYKVTYPESIEPGSYMVRVDGLNGYSGAIRKVYTIK